MNYNELIKTLEIDGKKVSEKYIAVFNSILEEKLIEKDNKIKKLEEENKKFKQGEIIPISVAEKSFEMRDQQLAIYKRALELACEEIDANSKGLTNARFKIQKIVNDWCIGEQMSIFDFFLQQAKKEIENEI